MHPVLFNIGTFPITSFGFLLVVAYLTALFVIWRLTNVYALNKEKILDLFLICTIASLIGGRAAFVLENINQFGSVSRIFAINQFPGFNFWGGFVAAVLVAALLSRQFKLQFWQVADIAVVGLTAGLVPGTLGCLLGSCQSGYPSTLPIAITQVGLVDKRFPIQVIELFAYLILAWYLWRISLKFHFVGKVALIGVILFSILTFIFGFFTVGSRLVVFNLNINQFCSLFVFIVSTGLYYWLGKRSIIRDLKTTSQVATDLRVRSGVLLHLRRT